METFVILRLEVLFEKNARTKIIKRKKWAVKIEKRQGM